MTNYEMIPEGQPPDLPDVHRTKEDVLRVIQERVWYMERVKQASLENTTENDWVLQYSKSGPVPYLQASGCEKIARIFGVKVSGVTSSKYFKDQGLGNKNAYVWEYMGTFALKASEGDSIECPGSRAADDPFFGGQAVVDERDVKMAAYSNMMANGISRLLGLRNLTVEMLQQAGLDPGQMRGVEYKGEQRSTQTGKAAPSSASSSDTDNHKKLFELMVQIVGNEQDDLERFLEEITSFPDKDDPSKMVPGVRSLKLLKMRRCQVTLGKLRKAVDDGVYSFTYGTDGKPAA